MMMRIFCIVLIAVFSGCAGLDVNEGDPESMYTAAEQDIDNDRYQLALERLQKLKNKHPYSRYSILAKLKIADVHFMMDSYEEAAKSYETFVELHPKHERVAYASFRVGESYFQGTPGNRARDQTPAAKALKAFEAFLKKFSTSKLAPKARERVIEVRNALAEKQVYIGNFYMNEDKWESAEQRFQKTLNLYSDTEPAKESREGVATAREEMADKKPERHPRTGTLIYQRYKK